MISSPPLCLSLGERRRRSEFPVAHLNSFSFSCTSKKGAAAAAAATLKGREREPPKEARKLSRAARLLHTAHFFPHTHARAHTRSFLDRAVRPRSNYSPTAAAAASFSSFFTRAADYRSFNLRLSVPSRAAITTIVCIVHTHTQRARELYHRPSVERREKNDDDDRRIIGCCCRCLEKLSRTGV